MTTLFLDTEFTNLTADCRLISLALVDPAGAEFYVELNDGWSPDDCSEFVHQIVLPQLDLPRHGRSRAEASLELRSFLAGYDEVEIVSDALAWDWPLLLELLGELPGNIRCREDIDLLRDLAEADIPHHALLDARLMGGAAQRQKR
ncbi:3'-5' exoribonuclease [Pseudomonas sp. Gutcm_11s]|uniref:3'-5' exoribonuclease n=1 Tax=Pseudomonas sp. Gutcm_11s TaxID=3026088 RepID=UPI00235FC714|nr:3'-5' exoribonuclease [Pseudomonas sp. Gutcm_11s]MDD0844782.1 3'-5' exoribonuclease [Pseudomonas sp. Gutcm_11s]